MFVLPRPTKRPDETLANALFYANCHFLSDVGVLYRDVNWHGVLPLPLFVFYFFTATRSLLLRARGL
jgi:hypothetical protein